MVNLELFIGLQTRVLMSGRSSLVMLEGQTEKDDRLGLSSFLISLAFR
jgi:hypothetical protein